METRTWEPKYDGHAPPNWRWGMAYWVLECKKAEPFSYLDGPAWWCGNEYLVEAEALNSPNDDAPEVENGLPPLAKLVGWLGDYTTEELAKHGITLAPEKDWATDLLVDLLEAWDMPQAARRVRTGNASAIAKAAIELLRTRFEQMKGER